MKANNAAPRAVSRGLEKEGVLQPARALPRGRGPTAAKCGTMNCWVLRGKEEERAAGALGCASYKNGARAAAARRAYLAGWVYT